MSRLSEYLNRHIAGNVFDRQSITEDYAKDGSILTMTPKLVALPETADDIRKLLSFVHQLATRELRLPVTVRGGGLDKTGAAIGSGLVISMEKLNNIEEIDTRSRLVRLQPGVTLGQLNQALRLQGLWLPVGYNPRATIGGLIASAPRDNFFNRYGGISSYVERLEIILANGELIQVAPYHQHEVNNKMDGDSAEAVLYRKITEILDDQADTILDRSMRPFDAAGYASITKVRENHTINLLPLIFASQGTLGVVSDIILHLEPLPTHRRRLMVVFHDLKQAGRFLNYVNDLEPYLLNIYDLRILEKAIENGKKIEFPSRKPGKGLLVMAGFDFRKGKTAKLIRQCLSILPDNIARLVEDEDNSGQFDKITSSLESYLNNGYGERTPILDDIAVPGMNLTEFLAGLKTLEQTIGIELPIFGSFATPSFSVRPDFDISDLGARQQIVDFMQMYGELIVSFQGSFTANYPEGRTRSIIQIATISPDERRLYAAIKEAFDPLNTLGTGVKLGASASEVIRHLRTSEKGGLVTP